MSCRRKKTTGVDCNERGERSRSNGKRSRRNDRTLFIAVFGGPLAEQHKGYDQSQLGELGAADEVKDREHASSRLETLSMFALQMTRLRIAGLLSVARCFAPRLHPITFDKCEERDDKVHSYRRRLCKRKRHTRCIRRVGIEAVRPSAVIRGDDGLRCLQVELVLADGATFEAGFTMRPSMTHLVHRCQTRSTIPCLLVGFLFCLVEESKFGR